VQITRNSLDTSTGPSESFTGTVYVDTVAAPSEGSRVGAACVHFAPGARTAWHTHPNGQTIWVTEGVGLCQRRGGPVEVIRPGDRVFFEPGENHWHGAAPTRLMTHIAMQQANDAGEVVAWGEHVSEEQYRHAPPIAEGEN
jgi:quercetin dioxygenase-like cupin family protein